VNIGIPCEIAPGETRVAMTPSLIPLLLNDQHVVRVQQDAGALAFMSDEAYSTAGASIVTDAATLYEASDVILKVRPPQWLPQLQQHEAELMRPGSMIIGLLAPMSQPEMVAIFAQRQITAFALELLPRITRAQQMDALTAMSTIAGYKAAILAADHLGKIFPLIMTATGTITPATVLVLGAGVAGLQAIATAKRLGARVTAFDPRAVVREQVMSVGATFIEMELPADIETAGGYAKMQSAAFLEQEQLVIAEHLPQVDAVICTAQIFGQPAPILITAAMIDRLRPGSIIVDLATEQGGNCEMTEPGKLITHQGVTIIGADNLPTLLPSDASLLYAHAVFNMLRYLFPAHGEPPGNDDPILSGTCITQAGVIRHPQLAAMVQLRSAT
jgi:H+-translocating NAD(P) transhydrogenase subunit alpha